MSRLALIFRCLFLTLLTASLVVACGKNDARKRPTAPGQKTTSDKGDPNSQSGNGKGGTAGGGTNGGGTTGGSGSGTSGTRTVEEQLKVTQETEDINLHVQKQNGGKSQKDSWKNNKALIEQFKKLTLKKKAEGSKFRFELSAVIKDVIKPISFQTKEAVSIEDLAKDVELLPFVNNSGVDLSPSQEEARKMYGKVELQFIGDERFLLRITKSEKEVLAVLFKAENDAETLKLVRILGADEKVSDDVVKNLNTDSDFSSRARKLEGYIVPTKEIIGVAKTELTKLNLYDKVFHTEAGQDSIEVMIGKVESIIRQIRSENQVAVAKMGMGEGKVEDHKKTISDAEGIATNHIYNIRGKIQEGIYILSLELQEVQKLDTTTSDVVHRKELIEKVIKTLSSANLPLPELANADSQDAEDSEARSARVQFPIDSEPIPKIQRQ